MVEKNAYLRKHESQLKDWAVKIGELIAKAEKAEADVRGEYTRQIEALQAKKLALERRIKEVRTAAEDAWEALRGGVERASAELKNALDSAVAKFK